MANNLCGLELSNEIPFKDELKIAFDMGFSFVSKNLFDPKQTKKSADNLPLVNTNDILNEDGSSASNSIVGVISDWIDVDSTIPDIRSKSEASINQHLSWANYLSLPAICYRVKSGDICNLARIIVSYIINENSYTRMWFTFPLGTNPADPGSPNDSKITSDPKEVWLWWSSLATLTHDVAENISAALTLCENLPTDPQVIENWLSEPVSCLFVPTSLFSKNSKGYPILSKAHQCLIKRFFKIKSQVILTGPCFDDRGYVIYRQYISWLYKNRTDVDIISQHCKGLEDQLQEPLQPLKDNLSSATYSIFEMDPYKYKAYEDAIAIALEDRVSGKKHSPVASPSSKSLNGHSGGEMANGKDKSSPNSKVMKKNGDESLPKQIIMVLGAGRGPLVKSALQASKRTNIPVRVYIVEKNCSAVLTLKERIQREWSEEDVVLISGDMRDQKPDDLADIFVSELLGSFGDNELSPECLDGAQKYLKPDGISIPYSYTSYLAPIQSRKMYRETNKRQDKSISSRISIPNETPYVVRLVNTKTLANPEDCFTFVHPRKDLEESNARHSKISFPIKCDAFCHGFAGYFHSVLYGDITLSIHPQHHSPDMFSWFPLFFPIESPLKLKKGDTLTVEMWRCVDKHNVWYEWAVTSPSVTKIHNVTGRAYKIGL